MVSPITRGRHHRPCLLALSLSVTLAGCFTPRFIPKRLTLPVPRMAPVAGGMRINHLSIGCSRNIGCPPEASAGMASKLGSQLEVAFPAKDTSLAPVEAKVRIHADWRSSQTYFFDAVSMMFFGHFPFVPQWGHAHLGSRITLTRPARPVDPTGDDRAPIEPIAEIFIDVKVPYTAHWYSWYRTDAAARAFKDAWKLLADQIVDRVGAQLGAWPSSTEAASTWGGRYLAGDEDDEVTGETTRRTGTDGVPTERTKITLDRGHEWRFLRRARRKPTPKTLFLKYLSAFSGLEAGYFLGGAWVKSEARDSFGKSYTVASGSASSRGYRLGAYTIPERSDWFIFPTLGFFSLDIDIRGFRQDIPLLSVKGASEIPAVGSDPRTGAPVDLGDPSQYRLELRSGYFGQRISGTLVYGTPQIQLFGTLEGGINLLEVRHTRVYLGSSTTAGYSAAWVRSGQLRGIVGIAIRPWHIAFRIEGNYEHYWTFSFPQELEFKGLVERDPANQQNLRKLVYVNAASAGTGNVFFSANFYY